MGDLTVSAYVELHTMKGGHSDTVNCLAFSPNGTHLASGGDDYALIIWNASQGRLLYRIMFKSAVDSVIWHPNYPDTVIVGCANGHLTQIHDFSPMQSEQYEINLGARSNIHCLEYHAESGQLAISMGEEVHITREKTQNHYNGAMILPSPPEPEITGQAVVPERSEQHVGLPERRLRALALKFNGQGANLIVSYLAHGIICWDTANGTSLWHITMPAPNCNIGGAAVSPGHHWIAVYNIVDGLDMYALGAPKKQAKARKKYKLDKMPSSRHRLSVQFIHEGQALIAGTTTGKVSIWETKTGELFQSLEHGEDIIQALSSTVHDKLSYIATGSAARGQATYIKIWRAKISQGSSDSVANLVHSVTPNRAVLDALTGLAALVALIGVGWACSFLPWATVWNIAGRWARSTALVLFRIAGTVARHCYVEWLAARALLSTVMSLLKEYARQVLRSLLLSLLPELAADRNDAFEHAPSDF